MPIVHIVLFKMKQQVIENGFEEFKARVESVRDIQVAKDEATELHLGPPLSDARSHGFTYGLYSVFPTREALDKYRVDPEHVEYVRSVIVPNTDGACAPADQTSLRTTLLSR